MENLLTIFWNYVTYTGETLLALFKTLDLGIILGINILTSVLKSVLSKYKQHWLTDQTILGWIVLLGLIAGWVFAPDGSATDDKVRSAVYYMGAACIFFMVWKHLIITLAEKVFGGSAAMDLVKNVFIPALTKKQAADAKQAADTQPEKPQS